MHMFEEVLKTLKKHIYFKRNQFDANREIKASFTEEDKVLHVRDIAMINRIHYKKRILEIKVSVFSKPAETRNLVVFMTCIRL